MLTVIYTNTVYRQCLKRFLIMPTCILHQTFRGDSVGLRARVLRASEPHCDSHPLLVRVQETPYIRPYYRHR